MYTKTCAAALAFVGFMCVGVAPLANASEPAAFTRCHVWVGTEDLPGYGRLEFQFFDGGRAVMIDARETVEGSFTRNGDSVTLTFRGVATYSGTIRGNSMSGTARDDTRTWSWNLQYQGQR